MTHLEPFSAGYYLAPDVRIVSYGGDRAVIAHDLYESLCVQPGEAVFGRVSSGTFQLNPEGGVPAETVAIPEDDFGGSDDFLLIERPESVNFR